jgi:hypothetical protein
MRDAKGVPEHDIGVVEVFVRVGGDPGRDALRGFAGGLGDVTAGWVKLGVVVWGGLAYDASVRLEGIVTYIWLHVQHVLRNPLASILDYLVSAASPAPLCSPACMKPASCCTG